MGIKLNNKLPPKFSTIDENEELDRVDSDDEKAQGIYCMPCTVSALMYTTKINHNMHNI